MRGPLPNTALQRTRSAPLRSPLSFETFGDPGRLIARLGPMALLTGLCVASFASAEERWMSFASSKYGYRVKYPASWYLISPTFGALDILNFPPSQRIKGVVIRAGGAEISVGSAPSGISTIDEWMARDVQGETVLDKREIAISSLPPDGCNRLTRIVWMDDVSGSGKAFQVRTAFYCSAGNEHFGVNLVNWKGDPSEPQYQDLALHIALSLRVERASK